MIRSAAAAALDAVGTQRRVLLQQMLQSKSPDVVATAAQAKDLTSDADLRELAFEGVLRFATKQSESSGIFDVLEKSDRLTLALKLLDHKDMASFHSNLVDRALDMIDGRKDAKYLAQLIRASRSEYSNTRHKVAQMLGRTFVPESADPLLELLKDDAKEVRAAAQASLDQIANYLDERAKWEKRFGKAK